MTKIPVQPIAALVEYLHEERKHYNSMVENGEDTSNHIYRSVKTVTDWLEAQGVHVSDPHAEVLAAIEAAFEAHGVRIVDREDRSASN